MTLASHPVWQFEPNWESSVTESLSWLTDVMMSPTGAEQRRSLRNFPSRTFKFAVAVDGDERSILDNMLFTHMAGDWYLPVWHDVTITTASSTGSEIRCIPSPSLKVGMPIFIHGGQAAEIVAIAADSISVSPSLATTVPAGSMVHPMTVARLVEAPSFTAMSDEVEVADLQFLVTEPMNENLYPQQIELLEEYRDHHVLLREPDWSDNMERGQERIYDTFDDGVRTPLRNDTAARAFPTQRHRWVIDSLVDHYSFYTLMQHLRGRAVPAWVPTWMSDLRVRAASPAGSDTITVARCGFTLSGGPRPEREDIMIEMVDGTRHYRRIVDSVSGADSEVIQLDQPLTASISPDSVLRVCFMSLMRLDQDSVEIEHLTDMEGVSEVQVTFRSAPDIRVADPAF